MPSRDRRSFLLTAAAALAAPALVAAPQGYVLDRKASEVAFLFTMAGKAQRGTMPVRSAEITLDFQNLADSAVDVSVDATRARTRFFLATHAMKGPEILDTEQFPTIRFVSSKVKLGAQGRLSDGAELSGDLTVRGVTRPVVFQTFLYRKPGSDVTDLSELSIQMRGQISRSAFGANGYADLVPDPILLEIRTVIRQQG